MVVNLKTTGIAFALLLLLFGSSSSRADSASGRVLETGAQPAPNQEPRTTAVTTTVVITGGASPDGRYEVRAFYEPNRDPTDYALAVVDARTSKVIGERLPSGGHFSYADIKRDAAGGYGTIAAARWHRSGDVVAITAAGTAHTRELDLYEIAFSRVEKIVLPDFVQNALGRVNATSIRDTAVTEVERWDGDVLRAKLTFRAYRTNVLFDEYSVPFSLRISPLGGAFSTFVTFDSMGSPRKTQ